MRSAIRGQPTLTRIKVNTILRALHLDEPRSKIAVATRMWFLKL